MNTLCPWVHCATFGWHWSSSSWEKMKIWNVNNYKDNDDNGQGIIFIREAYVSRTTSDILRSICFFSIVDFAYMPCLLNCNFVYRMSFYWCTKLRRITSRLHLKLCIIISDIWRSIHSITDDWGCEWKQLTAKCVPYSRITTCMASNRRRACQMFKTNNQTNKANCCIKRERFLITIYLWSLCLYYFLSFLNKFHLKN